MRSGSRASDRRSFLKLCGGSVGLAYLCDRMIGRAEGATPPKRLVILHRPNGSISEDWIKNGQTGSILEPFKDLWPYAVALKGVNVRPSNGTTGGSHEAGLVTIMTGAKLGAQYRTNDDFRSTAESLDQKLVRTSAVLGDAKVKYLTLTAHAAQDGGNEIPNTALSYAGPERPIYPTKKPGDAYKTVFADFMPGGATGSNADALAKARARRQSVLDFVKWDLTRAKTALPSSFRGDLEMHEGAIREIEQTLDTAAPSGGSCAAPTIDPNLSAGGNHTQVETVGLAHLKLVTAAFACDLTRVVTFMWGTGASLTNFGPLGAGNHHSTSHANNRKPLSAVDRWYSEKTAIFIKQLVDTPDIGGGKLIDNTLVWYINEVSEGWNHSFNDYPFVMFGGDGVGLRNRGRIHDVGGMNKTSNDVWSALAPVFGTTLSGFNTASGGAISGLFT